MPLGEAMVSSSADGVNYSFAMEYKGPPLPYDLPRAVPINVERIPIASVVAEISLSEKLSFPVVQPLLAPATLNTNFCKEVESFASKYVVYPEDGLRCRSKKSNPDSDTIVSPTSVIGFEERSVEDHGCILSCEMSSSGCLAFSRGSFQSGELSEMANSSRGLGSSSFSHARSCELLSEARISSTTEFSGSFTKSQQSLNSLGVSNGGKESSNLIDLNQVDWNSNESVLSTDYPSSRVSSGKAVNYNTDLSCVGRKQLAVTFCDILSDDVVDEDFSQNELEILQVKREPSTKGKKGSCYRCFKGNRFTEKEICIVCDAKYCSNCVLRAMGSMPEGRKCVVCIGFPIEESKRGTLGKCSRMLKRLLNELEVHQIMKAEKWSEVNQLPPEYVFVNGKPLSYEELVLLQSCPNPPKKLKPGNYWYDKVSGFWGKEGEKPSNIITPHLNIGGLLKAEASNGNTQVFINGREITKVELRMLQMVGVQCAGNLHFWLNEDGSYQEEGQKNTKGYIWGKAGTKLVCAMLSLPVPSKSLNSWEESSTKRVNGTVPEYLEQRTLHKLLLVGYGRSGTSTIFKQAKILYKDAPFSKEERENIKQKIQSNVYGYLGILLEGRERFEDELLSSLRKNQTLDETGSIGKTAIYAIGPKLKEFSDWILKTMVTGNLEVIFPAATREYAPLIEELWNDAAVQATYNRRSELDILPDVSSYFLEQIVDILKADYEPSDLDILYAEGVTSSNGLCSVDFSFPHMKSEDDIDSTDQLNSLLRYQLIRVQARGLGENNCKWLEMFEDVGVVIFCVSLSDYDQYSTDGDGHLVNNMLLSRKFFESLAANPSFDQTDFLLLLNKYDLLEEKIEHVPLNNCEWFEDFHPMVSRHCSNGSNDSINSSPSLGQLAFHYIAVKFKRIFSSLTGRRLYVSLVKGLEPCSVDAALKYAREISKWNEERSDLCLSEEYSTNSTEASSFSP